MCTSVCTHPIMVTKQKDYQYEFVDPLPEECPCPVCLEVQVDPHQVTCCGKIFCKSCLDKLIRGRQNCPNCRKNLNNRYFPDLNTERRIKQLRVRCDNHTRGCNWVGCMKDLKDEHIPKCPNHLVPCTNLCEISNPYLLPFHTSPSNCGVSVQRHDLHNHMTQLCKWRLVKCSHCKLERTHYFINGEHIRDCPEFPINCTNNGCQTKIKRKNLPEHPASCPKQIVSCRYSSVGCKAIITRENIVSHNQECVEQHLDSAVDTVEKALKRIEILEAKAMTHRDGNVIKPLNSNSVVDNSRSRDYIDCECCGNYHSDSSDCPRHYDFDGYEYDDDY